MKLSTPDAGSGAATILIAEDDAAAAEMLVILLEKVGYRVRVTMDGAAALRALDDGPAPDVVLLDWMLPEISGLEVCRQIRQRWDALSLPILMVTAKADSESKAAAFEVGANDYITKPFFGAELRARIAAHLRIKQLSEERRSMDEHLMEREKLSTLGLLVSGVAHDLNNPLGGISGYAQLLLEEETEPDKRASLDRILIDVKRCNRIVSDLLSFARRHSPECAEVDLAEVLTRTVGMRERHLLIAGVTPIVELQPDLPYLFGDEHQLQQVFVNLLINAEHALREAGSTLKVSAERLTENPASGYDWVAVRFFNDGPPIPDALIQRIFEPFFTTKGSEEGTGLGLAICQRVVREHGGEIQVETGPQGTIFSVVLPLRDPPNTRAAVNSASAVRTS
jgi:signal transduction histidine kinase